MFVCPSPSFSLDVRITESVCCVEDCFFVYSAMFSGCISVYIGVFMTLLVVNLFYLPPSLLNLYAIEIDDCYSI